MFKELFNPLMVALKEMLSNLCRWCVTIWWSIMVAKDMIIAGEYKGLYLAIKSRIAIIAAAVWREIVSIFKEICENWEAAVILICAVFGLTFLLGQIPLTIPVPPIFEADMVIPTISTLIVMGLGFVMQVRTEECVE